MTYLQQFGLGFVVLHTISIMFINRISLGKRLFLAGWMALFVLGAPMIYAYVPNLAFIAIGIFAVVVYVITLFYQESKALKRRLFGPRRRTMSMEDLWDIEDDSASVPYTGLGATSIVSSANDAGPSQAQPAEVANQQVGGTPREALQPAPATQPQTVTTAGQEEQAGQASLLNDMLSKLEQIDHLMSTDAADVAQATAETERLAESLKAFDRPASATEPVKPSQQDSQASKASLESLFYGTSQAEAQDPSQVAGQGGLSALTGDKFAQPLSATVKEEDILPLTEAEEEELLSEIDDIIASHTDLESERSKDQASAKSSRASRNEEVLPSETALVPGAGAVAPTADQSEVFTLKPIAEQTIEIIKEKQDQDGLLSVEEQIDKELYFQFLLYESKELLAMGMYQETVDYLKEILIDSYDKTLRRDALELLESIKVDLYHPKLLGDMNKDYKKLEERKVL